MARIVTKKKIVAAQKSLKCRGHQPMLCVLNFQCYWCANSYCTGKQAQTKFMSLVSNSICYIIIIVPHSLTHTIRELALASMEHFFAGCRVVVCVNVYRFLLCSRPISLCPAILFFFARKVQLSFSKGIQSAFHTHKNSTAKQHGRLNVLFVSLYSLSLYMYM